MFFFGTRIIWKELKVPSKIVESKFIDFFGTEEYEIDNRADSIKLLKKILDDLQRRFCNWIDTEKTQLVIKDLYKVLDESHHIYMREKKARTMMQEQNIAESSVSEVLEKNRNIARNIIDATNIWIENSVLLQHAGEEVIHDQSFELNCELVVDLYIYGLVSQAMSLLSLSKKFGEKELFYGLRITPYDDIPAEVIKEQPIIYFNTLIAGNQNILSPTPLTPETNNTDFGIGFKKTYGDEVLLFLATMHHFQQEVLYGGKVGLTIISKSQFVQIIEQATNPSVKAKFIIDNFTLTRERVKSQLKNNDPIIWVMGANKVRHELNPFICLDNDRVMISYCALEQSIQLWVSMIGNGGMCYSNVKDELTVAIEKRNKELSDILVDKLREKLRNHYDADFDEIDVKYHRIYGTRQINYGDFDLIFYSKKSNELFLIEAKFFSDSLTSSGMVTDYEKLFVSDGYYDRCRRRYDLVLKEPEKLKTFVGIEGDVNIHFLFVSSKPLDIELQDEDGVVTFLCLSNFDRYIEGKFLDIYDESVIVRPTTII